MQRFHRARFMAVLHQHHIHVEFCDAHVALVVHGELHRSQRALEHSGLKHGCALKGGRRLQLYREAVDRHGGDAAFTLISGIGFGDDVALFGIRQRNLRGHGPVGIALPLCVWQREFRDHDLIRNRAGHGVIVDAADAPDVRIALLLLLRGGQPIEILGSAQRHGIEVGGGNAQVEIDEGYIILGIRTACVHPWGDVDGLQPVLRSL